jgi:hypothetical protein
MTKNIAKATVVGAFLSMVCLGQPNQQIHQDAKHSSCSNIVALTGNVKVNCNTLTPAQLHAIEKIPSLVQQIIENKSDAEAIMAKLDEILEHLNPNNPSKTYSCYGWRTDLQPGSGAQINLGHPESEQLTDRFEELMHLNNTQQYQKLLSECQAQMRTTPEWLTPRLFCGLAYVAVGDKTKAKQMLDEFDSKTGPAYSEGECKRMEEYLRQRTAL